MFNILIAEDDLNTRKYIAKLLENNGFRAIQASNGAVALKLISENHIDLAIIDVMMPEMNGIELTDFLRKNNYSMPLLMVTAKGNIEDKKKGFLVGIDDYLVKPFDSEELLLRVNALLRRSKIVSDHKLVIGDVTLDYDSLTVTRFDEVVELPKKEFYLLYKLLSYPNVIFTRYQLMDEIWGMDSDSDDKTITVHINRLRNQFGDYPEFEIQTIRGLGYKAVKKVWIKTKDIQSN